MLKMNLEFPFDPSRPEDRFDFFLLNALYGIIAFKLFALFYLVAVPAGKSTDFSLYIAGWILSLLSASLASILILLAPKVRFPAIALSFRTLVLFNLALLVVLLFPKTETGPFPLFAVFLFLLVQPLGILLAKNPGWRRVILETNSDYYCLILLGVSVFLMVCPPASWRHGLKIYNHLLIWAVFGSFWFGFGPAGRLAKAGEPFTAPPRASKIPGLFFYLIAFLFIAYLVINPRFYYLKSHYAYYLGPVTDLAAGKSLLVNINTQYGIGVIYFLRCLFYFLPVGYSSFAFILALLIVLQYSVFYFIVLRLFRSQFIAFLYLSILILINHFAQNDLWLYPSVGPLRFGFAYLLILVILLREDHPRYKRFFFIAEAFLAGAAFWWSFEVCVYTLPPFLIFLLYESLDFQKGFKLDFKSLIQGRLLPLFGWISALGASFYFDVFRRTGEWPHWSYYFDYISLYKNGFGMEKMPGIGYWWFIVAVLYFSVFAILAVRLDPKEKKPLLHINVVVFATLYGIFQFFYYLGRSSPNNLFHISMPCILIAGFWLFYIRACDPPALPSPIKKWGWALAALLIAIQLQKAVPAFLYKMRSRPLSLTETFRGVDLAVNDQPWNDPPVVPVPGERDGGEEGKIMKTNETIQKYSGSKRFVVYFLGEEGLDLAMYAGRINAYPFNDSEQAAICPPVVGRLKAFDPDLKTGDYLYTSNPKDFEADLFEILKKKYVLKRVPAQGGLDVYRVLEKRKSG